MKWRIFAVLSFVLALAALPVFAADLHSARASGLVGEKRDGYVGAVQATGEISALVSSVNAQRRQEYERIANEKGQPVDVVAKLAAEEIINKLPAGSLYQGPDGSWKKR